MDVLVSICCLVYNHEKYLRKTLEGFVTQKTNFPYEILIHDDASTDNSPAIIREYCEKYPDLFRPILQTENQHSKRIPISRTYVFPLVRGEYIATCEGDDYWCDPDKLQLQVDYMQSHPDCSMCVHDTAIIDIDGNFSGKCINACRRDRDYRTNVALRADGGNLYQTSAVLARRHIIAQRPMMYNISGIGDIPILIYAGISGYIHYIGRVMSCYRVGHSGSWSTDMDKNPEKFLRQKESEYTDLTRIDRETEYRYTRALAIPRGLRLSILYRKQYGLKKLLANPKHLFMVLRTHCHTFPRKLRKALMNWLHRKEHIPL